MLYLICSMIPGVNLERYGDLVLKTWVSKKCATRRVADVSKLSKLSIDIRGMNFLEGQAYSCLHRDFSNFQTHFLL